MIKNFGSKMFCLHTINSSFLIKRKLLWNLINTSRKKQISLAAFFRINHWELKKKLSTRCFFCVVDQAATTMS